MTPEDDTRFMLRTLELALAAQADGEPPFAAIVVDSSGEIVTEGSDEVRRGGDFSLHAEINVVRRACQLLGPDLSGCTLYTTVEPCPMCFTAAWLSRVQTIVFGTSMEAVFVATAGQQRELHIPAAKMNTLSGEPLDLRGGVLAEQCLRPFQSAAGTPP
ncbi:MAG TPA: nucleoside deaminase [Polyangiaceae bacterium]|nr:nucleoside deaminase [Polyangiaceae bacterium]